MELADKTDISLDPPSAYIFSVEKCTSAYRLNKFAIGLRNPVAREAFIQDENAAMTKAGLSDAEIEMVAARDWTGLIAHGGHVLAIVKIAYSLGQLHHEVGALMCGMNYAELRALLPKETKMLPEDLD
jgi:protocatechuate 4,5-dioxygenase alpha chain